MGAQVVRKACQTRQNSVFGPLGATLFSFMFAVVPLTLAAAACAGEVTPSHRAPDSDSSGDGEADVLVFDLQQPFSDEWGGGGLFAHDLNGDGIFDFLVTSKGCIGAYAGDGKMLWVRKDDIKLWEYAHHPSAIAGDVDGDGEQEVGYLTSSNQIKLLDGATGTEEKTLSPGGAPIAMAIADLRGLGDHDAILQYSQTKLRAIKLDDGAVLWQTTEYRGIEHSPLRQADLDGDGKDEVAGASIIDHDGTKMNSWDLGDVYKAMDSIVIADIRPGYPLEVALAEQEGARSHTTVVDPAKILFRSLNPWDWEDPDKLAVGDFDPRRPGLEIFCRSSGGDGTCGRSHDGPYVDEVCPWLLDSSGNLISKYYVNDRKPSWWTGHGIEEIARIDWDGDDTDEIVAKERHKMGAAAVINPLTGEFLKVFRGQAMRVYAADVSGDYREEVIVLDWNGGDGGRIRVFRNSHPNTRKRPRYWERQHYRRQKQNWNYYSP